MSLSEQIQRVDGSQNDILKALAQSYGINTSGLKIDQLAAAVKASQKFKLDGLLSTATAKSFGLPTGAAPDDAFKAIKTLLNSIQSQIDKSADIVTGSYVGTGKFGVDNPNSITFENPPVFVVVLKSDETNLNDDNVMIWVKGVTGGSGGGNIKSFSQENNTLKWWCYNSEANYQLNILGTKYYYAAAIKKEE